MNCSRSTAFGTSSAVGSPNFSRAEIHQPLGDADLVHRQAIGRVDPRRIAGEGLVVLDEVRLGALARRERVHPLGRLPPGRDNDIGVRHIAGRWRGGSCRDSGNRNREGNGPCRSSSGFSRSRRAAVCRAASSGSFSLIVGLRGGRERTRTSCAPFLEFLRMDRDHARSAAEVGSAYEHRDAHSTLQLQQGGQTCQPSRPKDLSFLAKRSSERRRVRALNKGVTSTVMSFSSSLQGSRDGDVGGVATDERSFGVPQDDTFARRLRLRTGSFALNPSNVVARYSKNRFSFKKCFSYRCQLNTRRRRRSPRRRPNESRLAAKNELPTFGISRNIGIVCAIPRRQSRGRHKFRSCTCRETAARRC